MTDAGETSSEISARLRRMARLSAVQALYQMEVSSSDAKTVVEEFRTYRFGRDDEPGDYIEANEVFFEDLVTGIASAQDDVDSRIAVVLRQDWKLSRLDAVVRAILRAGGYELINRPDIPAPVVINEYVNVAHAFFENSEPGFVNASLDVLAKQVRET